MRSGLANKSNNGGVDEEVADFMYDVRLARRWKRRRHVGNRSSKLNSCSNRATRNTINNSNSVVCKGEVVDFKLDSCSNRDLEKDINNNNNGDDDNDDDDDDDDVGVEEVEVDADYEVFLNGIRSYGDGDDDDENDNENDDVDGDLDPQYMMFLSKLKVDGTSYVLEVPLNVDISGFLKYDTEDGSCDDGRKSEDLGATENCPMRKNTKSQRILRSVSRRMKIENVEVLSDVLGKRKIESPRTLRSVSRKESMKTKKNLSDVRRRKSKSPMIEKNVKVEDASPVNCQTKERSTKKPIPESFHSAKQECNSTMECDIVDECYQVFLSCLKKVGKNMVFMPQSGEPVIYEEEDVESASDPEVTAMDDDPFSGGNYTPFVASKTRMAEPGRCSQSQFREKLMDILTKPYDNKEYKDLLEEVSRRRPKKRHLDLRHGRGISCSLESAGKSYLDYHKNLAAKIKSAGRDRRKILNLLRGFIYWLQNLTNEGSFHPWTDSLCLKVLPQF